MGLRKLKDKKCAAPGCDKTFTPANGFQKTCYSIKCAQEYARHTQKKKQEKMWRKEKSEWEIDNDKRKQKNMTQSVFNRLRVLEEKIWFAERGLEPVCISCGKPNMDWCCGHYKTRGSHPELAFDRKNTFLQCNNHCNKHKSGNIQGYTAGLLERFGQDEGNAILDYLKSPHEALRMSGRDYYEMRLKLLSEEKELRKKLNQLLDISAHP